MVARGLTLILCGTVLSACASDNIRDLSTRPPFNRYVGRTVHLLRPAYLMYEDFWTGPQYGISTGHVGGVIDLPLPVGHRFTSTVSKLIPRFRHTLLLSDVPLFQRSVKKCRSTFIGLVPMV